MNGYRFHIDHGELKPPAFEVVVWMARLQTLVDDKEESLRSVSTAFDLLGAFTTVKDQARNVVMLAEAHLRGEGIYANGRYDRDLWVAEGSSAAWDKFPQTLEVTTSVSWKNLKLRDTTETIEVLFEYAFHEPNEDILNSLSMHCHNFVKLFSGIVRRCDVLVSVTGSNAGEYHLTA